MSKGPQVCHLPYSVIGWLRPQINKMAAAVSGVGSGTTMSRERRERYFLAVM